MVRMALMLRLPSSIMFSSRVSAMGSNFKLAQSNYGRVAALKILSGCQVFQLSSWNAPASDATCTMHQSDVLLPCHEARAHAVKSCPLGRHAPLLRHTRPH
eukprot:2373749-Pyramimonas_sp.AAC.2